ncbi:YugN family protein [Brevibacillus sp. B_LB10_24]|uniref:YugN family protein n=1 Tax=Brevibacillus sp. B_LB10_24 TaxID=3380645 RepID=UPI0038B9769D
MLLKDTGIGNKELILAELDEIMNGLGFIRWAWDYNHATYDYKMDDRSNTYYLRVPADVVEGGLEDPHTLLKTDEPFIGKHLFPHGLDYDAEVPKAILDSANRKLSQLKEKLSSY